MNVVNTQKELSPLGETVRGWLYKPIEKVWSLPRSPIIGISLAIIGHSLWNGSSWLIGWIFKDTSVYIQLFANIGWIIVMIAGLWYIGREILAAVMHLPS